MQFPRKFKALNLAYNAITKKRNVEDARKAHGGMIQQAMGDNNENMKKLMLLYYMSTPDSDENTIGKNIV